MKRDNSLEKTLMLGKIEGKRREWQRLRWLDSVTASVDMNWSKLREIVEHRGAWWASIYGVAQSRTRVKRLSSFKRGLCIIFTARLSKL